MTPLSTEIVGSYHKPNWLVRRDKSFSVSEAFFRPETDVLDEAKQAAVRLAIDDQERAGLDVVTDGEQTRQSFSGHFFKLGGIDLQRWQPRSMPQSANDTQTITLKETKDDRSLTKMGPTVTGPIAWTAPIVLDDLRWAKRFARKPIKMTLVGPFTLATRLVDEYYGDFGKLLSALADALNKEAKALEDEGLDVIQFDDPEIHFKYSIAKDWAVDALNRSVRGLSTTTACHVCYGYALYIEKKWVDERYGPVLDLLSASDIGQISLEYEQPGHQPDILRHVGNKIAAVGFINSGAEEVETVDHIAQRASAAMEMVPPERLKLSSDCGMWFLPRESAYGKIANLARAAARLRERVPSHA